MNNILANQMNQHKSYGDNDLSVESVDNGGSWMDKNNDCETNSMSTSPSTCSEPASPRGPVSFSKVVRVVLIPSRKELCRFSSNLWWTQDEIQGFKLETHSELFDFMTQTGYDIQKSLLLMYQPDSKYSSLRHIS